MTRQRLADWEEELAAACVFLSQRLPEAADALDELGRQHLQAAARLRTAPPPRWRLAIAQLRAAAWPTAAGLEWLRQAELELARRYTSLHDLGAADAWQRYLRAEHLAALAEFGELSPA